MHKKQNIFIVVLTIVVVMFLSIFVGHTIHKVNNNITQTCFDELGNTSRQLAQELYKTTDMDRAILTAIGAIIAESHRDDVETLCEIMNTYNTESSYVTYVELLRPDNTMLSADGYEHDVSGSLDFKEEVKKGAYISNMTVSTLDPEQRIVRNAVPVLRDGETIYMLYGVIRLEKFADDYTTNIYDGHAYVYLLDGDSGDMLLDTWHKSFGNIQDFAGRKALEGYSFDQVITDTQNGQNGEIAFISQTRGGVLYMHYEPVGINNWSVLVTVQQTYAMHESGTIRSRLYQMAAVIGGVVLLYMVCVSFLLLQAYRTVRKLGMEDQTTGLQNRNAYDTYINHNQNKVFSSIVCIYADANGLHEINNRFGHKAGDHMLKVIADAFKSEFDGHQLYRIGGDEFVVMLEQEELIDSQRKLDKVRAEIESHDYFISTGIVWRREETGVNRITQEADAKMLEDKKQYYKTHDRRTR